MEQSTQKEGRKWLVNTAIGLLAVVGPFIIYYMSSSRKNLDFEIKSQTEITKNSISVDGFKVTVNGKNVEELYVYGVKILNSGSEPIIKDDFEKNVTVSVSNDSELFSAIKKMTYPDNLSLNFEVKDNRLLISPLLLNPGDWLEMDIYSSTSEYPTIDARIAGISKINRVNLDSKKNRRNIITITLSLILVIFYGKHLALAAVTRKYNHTYFTVTNTAISVTCVFSAIFLFMNQMGADFSISSMMAWSSPSVLVGYYWGIVEGKYQIFKAKTYAPNEANQLITKVSLGVKPRCRSNPDTENTKPEE